MIPWVCGRYSIQPDEKWRQELGLVLPPEALKDWWPEPSWNVSPTQEVPVVFLDGESHACFGHMRWGLVPHWVKPDVGLKYASKFSTINARSETVAEKPSFREPFKRRRCLLPASGYYEWFREGGAKRPFLHHKPDGSPLVMAGVWDEWRDPQGVAWRTCALLTTGAGGVAAIIHDRMPVILHREHYNLWLAPDTPAQTLGQLLLPFDGELEVYEVDRRVNSTRNNDPSLVQRLPTIPGSCWGFLGAFLIGGLV